MDGNPTCRELVGDYTSAFDIHFVKTLKTNESSNFCEGARTVLRCCTAVQLFRVRSPAVTMARLLRRTQLSEILHQHQLRRERIKETAGNAEGDTVFSILQFQLARVLSFI